MILLDYSMLIMFVLQSGLKAQNCDDAVCSSDEKTIKAVCEQMKVSCCLIGD